jgi:hypothetical protein
MATEFNTFHVTGGHMTGPHRSRKAAEREAEKLRKECPCEGMDDDCANDDMFPHGISVSKSTDGYWDNSPDY